MACCFKLELVLYVIFKLMGSLTSKHKLEPVTSTSVWTGQHNTVFLIHTDYVTLLLVPIVLRFRLD